MLSRRKGLALCLWFASMAGCTGGPISDFPHNDAVGEDDKHSDAGMGAEDPVAGDGDVSVGDGDAAGNLDGGVPPSAPGDGGVRDGSVDGAVDDGGLDADGGDARVTPADAGVPDAA